jgi:hypothetical protein
MTAEKFSALCLSTADDLKGLATECVERCGDGEMKFAQSSVSCHVTPLLDIAAEITRTAVKD